MAGSDRFRLIHGVDVVYPLKRSGGGFRELRFSMRSLRNLPHGRVFVVGGKPPWLRDATHLRTERQFEKHRDSSNNLLTACMSDEVSDPFILMNDDFFIMDAIDAVPTLNRGTIRSVIEGYTSRDIHSRYVRGMVDTLNRLESHGYIDPLSFELHTPLVVHKSHMLDAMALGDGVPVWHKRTAYGALLGLTGETVADVKVYDYSREIPTHLPFLSTSDESFKFGHVGYELRRRFTEKSPYEV